MSYYLEKKRKEKKKELACLEILIINAVEP